MANGNKPRILFGRTLGALHIFLGFAIAIILVLSSKSRWWRLMGALAWFLGFNFLLCGANGICLVLYATHDRHLRPWEQLYNDNSWSSTGNMSSSEDSDEATLAWSSEDVISSSPPPSQHHHHHHHHHRHPDGSNSNTNNNNNTSGGGGGGGGGKKRHVALEAFGTANSYGHEIWVEKYRAKMMVRKIFDKSIWVENESIRIMQDKVALQALIWSILVTVPLTVLFTAVPAGKFF